eukprot:1146305-Pelagomonas_calceolata.AAC.7
MDNEHRRRNFRHKGARHGKFISKSDGQACFPEHMLQCSYLGIWGAALSAWPCCPSLRTYNTWLLTLMLWSGGDSMRKATHGLKCTWNHPSSRVYSD